MNNGTIISETRDKQITTMAEVLKTAQERLKEVKYRGTYPTLYDFLNWSLKNSENILVDISNVSSIDNRIILARKLFEIYISVKVTRKNVKLGIERDKLIPKFVHSPGKKMEIKKLCQDLDIEKEFYTFYSTFAHPYTYTRLSKTDELNIETSKILYYINDYEYKVNSLNQLLMLYIVKDMIEDINYIIKRCISDKEELIKSYDLNKEFVYKEALDCLDKINKRSTKK